MYQTNLGNFLSKIREEISEGNISQNRFEELALLLFDLHAQHNPVYKEWIEALHISPRNIHRVDQIPFLPIRFFKNHSIGIPIPETFNSIEFHSSGTTGTDTSKHVVHFPEFYIKNALNTFSAFYGNPSDWVILALLPGYLERSNSSLVYMVDAFISMNKARPGGFFLNNHVALIEALNRLSGSPNIMLLGVSFGLLDFVESEVFSEFLKVSTLVVMETGGMKGRRTEITRQELHTQLSEAFGVENIHSEYGMTELLSQAYSQGKGKFSFGKTMQVRLRNTENPLEILPSISSISGGINVIDLANLYSCPFIATDDLGKWDESINLEILGRFDQSEIRGCNLMV